jgi:hypothetical protein
MTGKGKSRNVVGDGMRDAGCGGFYRIQFYCLSRVELDLKLATTIQSSEREIRWRGTKITGSFISAQRVLVPHEPS